MQDEPFYNSEGEQSRVRHTEMLNDSFFRSAMHGYTSNVVQHKEQAWQAFSVTFEHVMSALQCMHADGYRTRTQIIAQSHGVMAWNNT